MKTTLFFLCVLCATAAFGQSAGTPIMQGLQFANHVSQASPHDMPSEVSLYSATPGVHVEHGERPLYEVAPKITETPLGDVARAQKKEHAADKKATIVWEN